MKNERGFMLLSAVFLTLIVSLSAMMVLNGTKKIVNHNSTLRIIAVHIANEQFAELESLAAQGNLLTGSKNFLGNSADLKNENINFEVTTNIRNYSGSLYKAEVKVEWILDGKNYNVEFEKIIRNISEE